MLESNSLRNQEMVGTDEFWLIPQSLFLFGSSAFIMLKGKKRIIPFDKLLSPLLERFYFKKSFKDVSRTFEGAVFGLMRLNLVTREAGYRICTTASLVIFF